MTKYDSIYDAITNIPNGRFFKICYRTELPLKSEFKNLGYKVYKYTFRITRTGVNYNSIKAVKTSGKIFSRANNTKWLVKNKIKTNINTGKDYIVIATMAKNEHKCCSYRIIEDNGRVMQCSQIPERMIKKSYFNKTNGHIRNINLENIIYISYGGEVIYGNTNI